MRFGSGEERPGGWMGVRGAERNLRKVDHYVHCAGPRVVDGISA